MKKIIMSLLIFISIVVMQAQVNKVDLLENLEKNKTGNQEVAVTATLKSSSRLFEAKDNLTSVILIIPSGSSVNVLGSDSTYLHVIFEENEGYIFKNHAVIDKTRVKAPVDIQSEKPIKEEQPAQQQQVSRFSYLESKYGSNMAARLISGKIWKGMSAEMVKDSWGSPKKINRVINSNVVREEWIYNNTWLYIENELLTEWGPIKK
jgi:hypothetical protein